MNETRLGLGLCLVVPVLLSGCGLFSPPLACTADARAAISVQALDKTSRISVLKGARVKLNGAASADLIAESDGLGLAHEVAGTFDLSLEKTGYKPWQKTGIVVAKDACHVIGVAVVAELEPIGAQVASSSSK